MQALTIFEWSRLTSQHPIDRERDGERQGDMAMHSAFDIDCKGRLEAIKAIHFIPGFR